MSKNRTGGLTGNLEWGSKARKNEDAERNRNNRARREVIAEQLEPPVVPTQTWEEIDGDWVADCLGPS